MKNPLVSVICLCYNQSRFVKAALDSIINQSYEAIQLIIVDDGSSDNSKEVIQEWLRNHLDIPFVDNPQNLGSTAAFNKGLALAHGKYIIDLAADDMLIEDRVARQVDFFERQLPTTGVIYSNGQYIGENDQLLHVHFNGAGLTPFEGNIYEKVIDTYFIPTPTMMMKKEVLDELGGYDESLAYEDFDFWVRSARNWSYAYQPEVLTLIRLVKGSQSQGYWGKTNPGMITTLKICRKILLMNQTEDENKALINRVKYEIRQAFLAGKKIELNLFFAFWSEIGEVQMKYRVLEYVGKLGLKLIWIRKLLR